MKVYFRYLFLLTILIAGFSSCYKYSTSNLPPNNLNVSNLKGTIGLYMNNYSIILTVPNTIDSRVVGIVNNLSEEFKSDGLNVVFSGNYSKSVDNPQPNVGGDDVYSLTLTSIEHD